MGKFKKAEINCVESKGTCTNGLLKRSTFDYNCNTLRYVTLNKSVRKIAHITSDKTPIQVTGLTTRPI